MGNINSFGNLLPVLSGLTSAVGAVQRTLNAAGVRDDSSESQQELALRQLRSQQKLQEQQLAQSGALERERIALQAQQDDGERRGALKRAVARQRAAFGASGIGNNGGSSEAVLLGLFEESEEERAKRERLDAVRTRAVDMDIAQNRSLNLLQATQLAQRQKLSRLG
jgi:hypothetical protein